MINPLFQRRGLSIDRLLSFLMVADAGGLAAAAPRNNTRQSQLSRQISELEEFFGKPLVERRGRGIALTPVGAHLAVVLRELVTGLQDVASASESDALRVSLGAGDSLLHAWVIPRIGTTLGGVSLTLKALSSADVLPRLIDARLDFGIVRTADIPASLRSKVLGTVDYALYVPKQLRIKGPIKHMLQSLPLAMQNGDPEFNERLTTAFEKAGIKLTPSLVCETFPQAQRAVATGRYAAVLPTFARAELPEKSFDEIRDPALGRHASKVSLVWAARLERQRPRVGALVVRLMKALTINP